MVRNDVKWLRADKPIKLSFDQTRIQWSATMDGKVDWNWIGALHQVWRPNPLDVLFTIVAKNRKYYY